MRAMRSKLGQVRGAVPWLGKPSLAREANTPAITPTTPTQARSIAALGISTKVYNLSAWHS